MSNSSPFAAKNRPSFYFDFANDKIFLMNLPVSTTKRPSRGRNSEMNITGTLPPLLFMAKT